MDDLAVCFDFDGTLIDSRRDIATAVNRVRQQFDLDELSEDHVAESIGSGTRELIEGTIPTELLDGDVEGFIEEFREVYLEVCIENVQPYDEIPPLVTDLSDAKLSIVTNKPLSMTENILASLNWTDRFNPVFGPDSFARGKPDPRPLQAVVDQWEINPRELVMIGDSWTDIRAGNLMGCRTVACLYGLGDTEKTLAESPDKTVESVEELRGVLSEVSG